MTKFIFVRHGQSEGNVKGFIADSKTELTELGIQQAKETGQLVKDMGIKNVMTSTYRRAVQTGAAIADELGVDWNHFSMMEELDERGLGDFEDKPREHPGEWYFTVDGEGDVEPLEDLLKRMQVALENIKSYSDMLGSTLVVGHSISGFYLMEVAKGNTTLKKIGDPKLYNNAEFIEVEF